VAEFWQKYRIPAKTVGLRHTGRKLLELLESGCSGQIPAKWPEYDQFGRRNLGRPDSGEYGRIPLPNSGDIDLRLLGFGTGKILMKVDCII
jgi:hypothetical protein